MHEFRKDYHVDPDQSVVLTENIVSTLQAGCFIASLVACPFADKYGRRWPLIGAALIASLGIALQAAQSGSLSVMYAGRLVAGFGVGAASMLTPLYVSECAPRAIRGALTGFYQLFLVNGTMLSFWVNYGSERQQSSLVQNSYTIPLALQALPAFPRYTAKKGRWEETTMILCKLTRLPASHPYVREELHQMAAQLEIERRLVGDATAWSLLKEMWTIRANRNRALLSIGLMIGQQLTGINAINYYAPQIFKSIGVGGNAGSLLATGVYGVVKTISCALFLVFAADSLGRRLSLLWTSVAQAVCMFVIGAEIPSTRLRAMNVAQAAATQWLFNFIVARTVPTMMATMGQDGYGTFFLFGSFCAALVPFTYFLIPETKGMGLEEMDELFGITEVLDLMGRLNDNDIDKDNCGYYSNKKVKTGTRFANVKRVSTVTDTPSNVTTAVEMSSVAGTSMKRVHDSMDSGKGSNEVDGSYCYKEDVDSRDDKL
ncbi:putative mfs quinate protein [Eutypa lata UCREL1]|uniref:Putative mfs quinate protein n=1 Tax=Eutypa lata (strain UCR-EL1) TaxID=1287681 RepID=M7T7C8_EUTLA|nr:putative mfs quinate protein [Eutypa lata UCREL1]